MIKVLSHAVIVGVVVLASGSAIAADTEFDFANLKYSNSTFSGFLPTDGFYCTGGDQCSSIISSNDSLSGDLNYTKDGINVTATGKYGTGDFGVNAAVVQDHDNYYNGGTVPFGTNAKGAGLGVYHRKGVYSDDNITSDETLWMHFDQLVNLSSIGLRSDGHNTTGWDANATFEYSFNNTSWISAALPRNDGRFDLTNTGTDFYIRFGGNTADQFYLSSMTVSAVPEAETFALMLAGLSVMGAVARRRKVKLC